MMEYLRLVGSLLHWTFIAPLRGKWVKPAKLARECVAIGVQAIPAVALMSICVGFVLALVLKDELGRFGVSEKVPSMIWTLFTNEQAPFLAALIFACRSASAITAELGTMQISEEVKALRTMGVEPVPYLLLPKFLAFLIMMPAVMITSIYAGLVGGYIYDFLSGESAADLYIQRLLEGSALNEVIRSLFKTVLFALAISTIAFHRGLSVRGNATDVAEATTNSVVHSIVAVTLINAVFTFIQMAG